MGLSCVTSRRVAGAGVLALAMLMTSAARAQPEDPKGRAQELFQQGLAAVDAGDCAQAIPLFQRSQATYPARGTLLNLAGCEAKLGKVASAWQHLKELVGQLEPSDPRLAVAREKMAALEPRIPRLVIEVAPGAPNPMTIALSGSPLPAGSLGADLPVDPGDHVLVVTWPGGATGETRVSLAEGVRQVVRLEPRSAQQRPAPAVSRPIPAPVANQLHPKPAAKPPGLQPNAPDSPPTDRRPLGFVIGGIGLAAVGVGAVTGILAIGVKSDLEETCPVPSACSQEGQGLASKGEALTTTGTITFLAGLAFIGGGIALVLTSPVSSKTTAFVPAALPGGGGAVFRGRF